MKKIISILIVLVLMTMPIFAGINENGELLYPGDLPTTPVGLELNRGNSFLITGTWNEWDLSGFTSGKRGKCLFFVYVIGYYDDCTEVVTLKMRPKGEVLFPPVSVSTRYASSNADPENTRQPIGVIECWTDNNGFIEWYSDYEQWYEYPNPNKTVIIQVKLVLNLN